MDVARAAVDHLRPAAVRADDDGEEHSDGFEGEVLWIFGGVDEGGRPDGCAPLGPAAERPNRVGPSP
jgi:hypothetical protein